MTADEQPLPFWFRAPDATREEPGATREEIEATETLIGHRLPSGLRRLLSEQNGGVSNYASVRCGVEKFAVLPFLSATLTPEFGSIGYAAALTAEIVGPQIVPFAELGHTWWGLDYRDGENPAVVFVLDFDSEPERVASSFDEFLQGFGET